MQADVVDTAKTFTVVIHAAYPSKYFTKTKKSPKVDVLPVTSTNLFLHMPRNNLLVKLWKAADQQAPPDESADITNFG